MTDLTALAKKNDLKGLEAGVKECTALIANINKKDNSACVSALGRLSHLAENAMLQAQPYLVSALSAVLDATGDKVSDSY